MKKPVFFLLTSLSVNSFSPQNTLTAEQKAIINKCINYRLTHVVGRYIKSIDKNNTISAEAIEQWMPAALELKRFFAIAALYPTDRLVMTHERADALWHAFLAYYPQEYKEFCTRIVESPIEHKPISRNDNRAQLLKAYESFQSTYKTLFGVSPDKNGWKDYTPGLGGCYK